MYEYRAELIRVVDGDTLVMRIDLGFYTYTRIHLRLMGVDTAEIHNTDHESEEYERGIIHKKFVEEWMSDIESAEWPYIIQTYKYDSRGKYGRWVADIIRLDDGKRLSDEIVAQFPDVLSERD